MTAECKTEIKAIKQYLSSFTCILMSAIWYKVLKAIDLKNKIIQARDATLDIEIDNIASLIIEIKNLRNQWGSLLSEAKLVAESISADLPTELEFPDKRQKKRKLLSDESQEDSFVYMPLSNECIQEYNFYPLIDSVIMRLTESFQKVKNIADIFKCLWQYAEIHEDKLAESCNTLIETYPEDIKADIIDELTFLKSIHHSNLGKEPLKPL